NVDQRLRQRRAPTWQGTTREGIMRYYSIVSAICSVLLVGNQAYAQQAPTPPIPPAFAYGTPITLEQARKVAAAAEAAARKRNMNMVIAVVEPNGSLVY